MPWPTGNSPGMDTGRRPVEPRPKDVGEQVGLGDRWWALSEEKARLHDKSSLQARAVADPAVVFDAVAAPSQTSHYVVINIQWQSPDPTQVGQKIIHNYTTAGVVGQN